MDKIDLFKMMKILIFKQTQSKMERTHFEVDSNNWMRMMGGDPEMRGWDWGDNLTNYT